MTLWDLFVGFLSEARDSMLEEVLTFFDSVIGDLLYASFFIEALPGLESTVLSSNSITSIINALYGVMVVLLVLKLLKKGFDVYVLWREGDPENPPGEMLVGAGIAVVTAIAFPVLYHYGVEIVTWVFSTANQALGSNFRLQEDVLRTVITYLRRFGAGGTDILTVLLTLVYIALFIWLLFVMLRQSAEMLAFRLAVPLAVVGFVNSDGGSWRPFAQALFRTFATILLRFFFACLASLTIAGQTAMSLLAGIALLLVAISTPILLQQFTLTRGSSGGMQRTVHTVSAVLRTFKGF